MHVLTSLLTLLSYGLLLTVFLSCTTPPKKVAVALPKFSCHCSPALLSDESVGCAVWSENSAEDSIFLAGKTHQQTANTCSKKVCETLGAKHCSRIVIWPEPERIAYTKPPLDSPCFCDRVVIEQDDRQLIACAAWHRDKADLIEYRLSADCSPQTCADEPFVLAKRQCPQGFHSFYLPEFVSEDDRESQ